MALRAEICEAGGMPRIWKRGLCVMLAPVGVCAAWRAALGVDIEGVLPAAIDQPQTHLLLQQNLSDMPLMGQDALGDDSYDIQSYLDTGTSTVLLSNEVWQGFGVNADSYDGQQIEYDDIGIGGSTAYAVSTPYYVSVRRSAATTMWSLGEWRRRFRITRRRLGRCGWS